MASKSESSKVLRIGIIQDGKIVQERLIKVNESVSVGESAKNTFVFPKTSLPAAEFTLFQPEGDGYALYFTDKMRGKVSSDGKVIALQKLAQDPSAEKRDGAFKLMLTEKDRGKITVDSVTVLFQFVAPPPVKAVVPMQAMDFRPRLIEDDDPVLLGFLFLWGLLALVFVIVAWNTEPREITFDSVPDRFTRLLIAPTEPNEAEVDEVDIEPEETVGTEVTKRDEPPPEETTEPSEAPEKPADERVAEAQQREADREEVMQKSKLLAKIIATTGESSGGVVENLWSDEEQGFGDLEASLTDAGGITTDRGEAGPREGAGGRGEAAGIEGLAAGGGTADVGEGVDFKAAQVVAQEGSVSELSGDAGAFRQTVQRNLPQLRYCYESRLKVNPTLQGRVEFGWSVHNGKVEGLYLVSNSTGDSEIADCMQRRIRRWTFPADAEGDVSWPFVFQPQ